MIGNLFHSPLVKGVMVVFLPAWMLSFSMDGRRGSVARMAEALRYPTVSYDDPAQMDGEAFVAFHAFLARAYPRTHEVLTRETVNHYSLLFTWPGTEPGLPPILLAAHMDVVPVDEATRDQWQYAPFSGMVANGKIHGRGAFDDKVSVIGILEAVESLLASGFTPARTILLAFGHDEEIGGGQGALQISQLLEKRGIKPAMVLDEGGGVIGPGLVQGIHAPMVFIGVAEKGEVNLRLVAQLGVPIAHSSSPPAENAVDRLSKALVRLGEHPFPQRIVPPVDRLLENMSLLKPGLAGFALRHHHLMAPLVKSRLQQHHITNAMTRTTMVPTMLRGSDKANNISRRAEAVINVRILPGDTVNSVKTRIQKLVTDLDVAVEVLEETMPRNPSTVTSVDGFWYHLLEQEIRLAYPRIKVITPWLVTGGTDARHYAGLTPNILRFVPFTLTPEIASGPHGVDEWIPVKEFLSAVSWYRQFLERAGLVSGNVPEPAL